jgi:predicted alpha/beta hydrolase
VSAPTPERIEFFAADGARLVGHRLRSTTARAALLINPATGFPQTYYFKLAQYAAARGYDSLVYDYRGMGESAHRAHRDETARMSDWGLLDMRAALDCIADDNPGRCVFTLGHSVGGQFLGLLRNHARARAHVLVATSIGYWRWQHSPFKWLALWFWRVHGPAMLRIKGYVPSGGGWAGLPLPRGVFEQWRSWCLRAQHFGPDLLGPLGDHVFGEIRAPLLSLGFADDPIATRRSVAALLDYFPNARREERWIEPRAVGLKRIGHEGFFRANNGAVLWPPLFDWLDSQQTVH